MVGGSVSNGQQLQQPQGGVQLVQTTTSNLHQQQQQPSQQLIQLQTTSGHPTIQVAMQQQPTPQQQLAQPGQITQPGTTATSQTVQQQHAQQVQMVDQLQMQQVQQQMQQFQIHDNGGMGMPQQGIMMGQQQPPPHLQQVPKQNQLGRVPATKHDNRKLFVGGLPNEG
jgi:hypothetical protein